MTDSLEMAFDRIATAALARRKAEPVRVPDGNPLDQVPLHAWLSCSTMAQRWHRNSWTARKRLERMYERGEIERKTKGMRVLWRRVK